MSDAPLPENCPICGDDLRAVARVEADEHTGASLACRCRSCGRMVLPEGALPAIAAWSEERRAKTIAQIRALRARDPSSVLVMNPD